MPLQLADVLKEKFQVRTRAVENPKVTSLGTTASLVFANNPNRLAWVFINLSANVIYLSLTRDVSSTRGIRLAASGGKAGVVWDEDFQMTAWAWWGVASGTASAVYSIEVVTY